MQELVEATDWKQALQDGRVTPVAGVDIEFDKAVEAKEQAEGDLTVRDQCYSMATTCVSLCCSFQQKRAGTIDKMAARSFW
jgi:hypothetical protein